MFSIPWSTFFLAPSYKLWFWILVPFIILYLIKPKPLNQTIPSLMFLLQDKGRAFKNSLFRYLFRDFVFFLQLLTLALLVAAACQPYITVSKTSLIGNSVIILDDSASMQTKDGRWDAAIKAAKSNLASQNTIILIQNRPVIIAKETSKGDAEDALNNLNPSDTETNMYSAIIAAREFAKDSDTRVSIISDFRNTEEQEDWHAALKAVQATGAITNLIQVGGKAKNVGIVSVDTQEEKTRIGVTNFEDQAVVVNLKAGTFEQPVPLAPSATDYVTISTPPGITQVTIDPHDDFPLDDTAYIANNQDLSLKLLIVTNNPTIQQTPFWYSLQSISDKTPVKLQIDVNNPPALATVSDYDVVFFIDVDPAVLVQRIVRETADQVRSGKAAVIMYQQNLWSINYEGMFSYTYNATGGASAITPGEFSSITKGIDFGDTQAYYIVSGSGRVLAQTEDGTPIISLVPVGKGKVLYYGIPDQVSSFPYEPYYPVFWKRALDELTGKASMDSLNYKTGATPVLPGALAKHPDFNYQGFLDKQGLYTFGNYVAAANLESQSESKVSAEPLDQNTSTTGLLDDTTKQKELTGIAMLAALILLFIELFIVKFRGDF